MLSLTTPLVVFLLVTICIGGLLLAGFQPVLARNTSARKRMALALGVLPVASPKASGIDSKKRRRSVEDTLREIAQQQKARSARRERKTLAGRLRQGGLHWSVSQYWFVCAVVGLAAAYVFWLAINLGAVPAVGFGIAVGLLAPRTYVNFCRTRRFARFAAEFPNAIDVIVRGVKSGMPLGDCLRLVAADAQEPVRTEFKLVMDNQTIGMPMDEAVQRLADRVPSPETRFLAIVIAIQSRSGGNLAEALGNLATVLRERKKMRALIRTMSSEAKASGAIIGALPVVVSVLVYLTSPDYMSLLFNTTIGNIVLCGCAIWMLTGVLVMRKMINFDF